MRRGRKPARFATAMAAPLLTLMLILMGQLSCVPVHGVATNATRSAVQVLKGQVEYQGQTKPVIEHMSAATVRGAVAAMNEPGERAQMGTLIDFATARALSAAAGSLVPSLELGPHANPSPGHPLGWAASEVGRGFVLGAFSGLDVGRPAEPESRPRLALAANDVASGFTRGLGFELSRQIGADGRGPLGEAIEGITARVAASTMRSAAEELAAQGTCKDEDPRACARARIRELGRATGLGVMQGVLEAVRVPLMVAVFASGVIVAVAASWLFRRRMSGGRTTVAR